MDYMKLYESSPVFRDYINRELNPKKRYGGRKLEELLEMRTVRDIGDYYAEQNASCDSPVSPVSPMDICDCEDKSC